MSQKYTPSEEVEPIIKIWLETSFEGGRHQRRLTKISEAEKEN
jgi:ribose 5-phosphate isomerase RpiB